MRDNSRFFIDGRWVASVEGRTLDVVDPATERRGGAIGAGSAADVDLAVAAARAAFQGFAGTSVDSRRSSDTNPALHSHCVPRSTRRPADGTVVAQRGYQMTVLRETVGIPSMAPRLADEDR